MSKIINDLLYTKDHEWVRVDGDVVTVGITDFAQGELGDIVFFELIEEGDDVNAGDSLGTVEAVKAVSDIYSPVSGEVIEINEELFDQPDLVNQNPYVDGWIVKIKLNDAEELDELMDAISYKSFLGE